MPLANIDEFVEACRNKTSDQIYTMFEDNISQELRNEIYEVSAYVETSEPFRTACNMLGRTYGVQELIDY